MRKLSNINKHGNGFCVDQKEEEVVFVLSEPNGNYKSKSKSKRNQTLNFSPFLKIFSATNERTPNFEHHPEL